ncbi:hypothetical protein JD844_008717 [Phrynosoma platyrhinos]|uniref:Myb-like domain-containing protein n=1 Tax=Phrynosoma platyrhinos TaxID=52577 RepID=A0ABQ7TE96_PHRPL|nr:hypothetical protein JD844_008717 [Phrynosoma platyrhinos]
MVIYKMCTLSKAVRSSLVEEKRTEKTSTVTQAKEPEERIVADHEDENEEDEDNEIGEEDGPLLVPRVKVAEDGSIILDEESLTVEVLRTKGQCVVEENDPIFERGSTTTYSSFRKSYYTKPWSEKETDMFFLAISMVGTDFSMISQLFPHRARTEIKNKFKREEKANGWRIDKAFKEKKPFDFDVFTKLLEKVLDNERKKKEKDAKCQCQKEKSSSEKKAHMSQKKRKEDLQSAGISDTEMEVDAETAEKENEVSPSILEQTEGQATTESVVIKKKRKKKKKHSEHETENLPEERTTSEEMAEGERLRKKRKNAPSIEVDSINEDDEELDVPDGVTHEESHSLVEEDPQCCIVNEEAEQDCISNIRDGVLIEAEPSELNVLEPSSEHHIGQPSVSPGTNKNCFKESSATQSDISVLDELDENQNAALPSLDEEVRETEIAITKNSTVEGQLYRTASDVTRASEKGDCPTDDISEVKISPPKSVGSVEKSTVEDKINEIIGPASEETNKASNGMESKSQQIQNAHVEKTEVRGRRQKPRPNIMKALGRKEASTHSNLDKPELVGAVEKNNDQDDVPNTTTVDTAEKDPRHLDTESLSHKKSTLQENSKQTVLKPAPLARGRIQRITPNLGRVVRRQGGAAKNTAAENGKTVEIAGEAEKTLIQPECNSSEFVNKNISEAIRYEANMLHCEVLQSKAIASTEKVGFTPTSPGKTPLEFENHEFKNTSLSSKSLYSVADHAARDSSLQQDQKYFFAETEDSLKSYCLSPKQNLGKAAEKEEPSQTGKELQGNKQESETTEESSVNISRKCSESSSLDEAANGENVPLSHLLEESSADAAEGVAPKNLHLSPPNLSGCEDGEPNKVLRSPNAQKNISLRSPSKQNSQGESKESVVQPTPTLRSRFHRPKPNVGRAVGRKETQSFKANEATVTLIEDEKSELQKPEPTTTSTVVEKPLHVSPAEALEKRSKGTEKVNLEDPQVPSTSHSILDPRPRDKPLFQESKLCTIKPAQLVRGWSQRARPSFGTIKDKKEELVSENISAPAEGEIMNIEMEIIKKGDLHPPLKCVSGNLVETVSTCESLRQKDSTDSTETVSPKRSRHSEKCDSLEETPGSKSQIKKEILKPLPVRRASQTLKGKQPRTLKQRENISASRAPSESENNQTEKRKPHHKMKPKVSKGRSLKSALRKKSRKESGSTKVSLVTLRASSQEEEGDDDDDDFELDYEVECFSPEEVNKAPVFVPKGLRSPNPVPVQIEETMEELEIYEDIAHEPCLTNELNIAAQPEIQGTKHSCPSQVVVKQEEQRKETGINDGSTEAAMTLLAMRDPVFQLNIATQEDVNRAVIEDPNTEPLDLEDRLQEENIELLPESLKNEPVSSFKVSTNTTEEQKVELEENLRLEELAQSSSAENHDLQLESAGPAMQKNNIKSENLVKETWEVTSELTASKFSPEAETSPTKLPCDLSANNVQVSSPVEHQLSPGEVAQVGISKYSSISANTNMTSVTGDIREHPTTEEEPTFILTLVEIPNDSEDCRDIPTSLPQTAAELLPAPVFFTPCDTGLAEPEREDRSVPELHVGEKEQPQSSGNVWAMLFDKAASTDKQVSRTLHAGKAERTEKQRHFVDTCKSLQSEQVGNTAVLPKTPLSRSYQRSLGFLPLICKNNNTDEEETTKGNKDSFQKTHEVISESAAKCPVSPQDKKEEIQENSSLPSAVPLPSKCEGESCSTVKVFSELLDREGSSKEQEKEEEPTKISEYFFSDIFMEVDDSE